MAGNPNLAEDGLLGTSGVLTAAGINAELTATTATKTSAKTAKTAGGVAGEAVGPALDIGFGIYNSVEIGNSSMTEEQKSYQITGEVLGIFANIATIALSGPAAIAVLLASILGDILDAKWNPLKNYYNNDLEDIRKAYNNQMKSELKSYGLNWPMEVKPNILNLLADEENLLEYTKYLKEYYTDNNLISPEEAFEEVSIYKSLIKLRKANTNNRLKNTSNLILNMLDYKQQVEAEKQTRQQELLLLVALVARARKLKQIKKKEETVNIVKLYIEKNYISIIISAISSSSIIILLFTVFFTLISQIFYI